MFSTRSKRSPKNVLCLTPISTVRLIGNDLSRPSEVRNGMIIARIELDECSFKGTAPTIIGEPVTFPSVMDIPDPDAPILLGCLSIGFGIFTFAR